jgi:hypothetical protein
VAFGAPTRSAYDPALSARNTISSCRDRHSAVKGAVGDVQLKGVERHARLLRIEQDHGLLVFRALLDDGERQGAARFGCGRLSEPDVGPGDRHVAFARQEGHPDVSRLGERIADTGPVGGSGRLLCAVDARTASDQAIGGSVVGHLDADAAEETVCVDGEIDLGVSWA